LEHFVIGLTGNIASGKSAVAAMLAEWGAEVIDADRVAHETLEGDPERSAVVARFGPGVQRPDGSIDRAALGRIVFADRSALADLEAILHPATRRRILERAARSAAPVVVIEAIKLLEGPLVDVVDAVWVVTAPRSERINRLVKTRHMARDEAERRVDAQNPESDKVRRADVVLDNSGSLEDLRRRARAAWDAIPRPTAER